MRKQNYLKGCLYQTSMTASELAEKLGVSKATACRWIADPQKMTVSRLRQVLRAIPMSKETREDILKKTVLY